MRGHLGHRSRIVHARLICSWLLGAVFLASSARVPAVSADDEASLFTPAGRQRPGQPVLKSPADACHVKVTIRDAKTGEPTFCRVNVVGSDGNFYYPKQNYLTPYALTGRWPKTGLGNREGKAPIRYLGRFFYSWGSFEVDVPPGNLRVEVWKGLEYRPQVIVTEIVRDKNLTLTLPLSNDVTLAKSGYFPGDSHLHFRRQTDADDQTILDLMEAEDVRFGSILAYNEPAGPYAGIMETLAAPQFRGLGATSRAVARRFPHLLRPGIPQLVRPSQSVFPQRPGAGRTSASTPTTVRCTDCWPARRATKAASPSTATAVTPRPMPYATIYADAIQGNVDGVELLQFGIYREMGLADWYRLLNIGYRFPCLGASDYPACRWLADCRTYVRMSGAAEHEGLVRGSGGRPQLRHDGAAAACSKSTANRPASESTSRAPVRTRSTARIRVRSEVAPVSDVHLIVNGKVVSAWKVPADQADGQMDRIREARSSSASRRGSRPARFGTAPRGSPERRRAHESGLRLARRPAALRPRFARCAA